MDQESLARMTAQQVFRLTPFLTDLPVARLLIDYDREADVLYVSFRRPQCATNSEMLDNGVLLNYCDSELVGMTIFEASSRTLTASLN